MHSTPNQNSPGQGARPSPPAQTRSPPAKRRRTNLATSNTHSSVRTSPPSSPSPSPSPAPSPSPSQRSSSPPPHPQYPSQTPAKWFRKPSVVWYRGNDLRVEDHPALLAAAQRGGPVVPFFVWDPLDGFGLDLGPVKQWWLRESVKCLERDLRRLGVQLYTRTGRSTDELRAFLDETGADAVFWNRCYEPDLLKRDEELRAQLAHEGLTAESFKAELLVEPWELSNTDTSACFETFHAYMRAWMNVPPPPQPFPCPSHLFPIGRHIKSVGIDSLGFDIPLATEKSMKRVWKPGSTQAKIQLDKFLHEVFPAFGEGRCRRHFDGTSRLSPHIRFGELSPRRMYHSTRLRVSQWDHTGLNSTTFVALPVSRRSPLKRLRAGRARDYSAHPTDVKANNLDSTSHGRNVEREDGRDDDLTEERGRSSMKQHELRAMQQKRPLRPDVPARNASYLDRRKGTGYRRPSLPHIAASARAFLKNLCLRDFSYHVLYHNPKFNSHPLIPEFNSFPWAEDNGSFDSWRNGVTGYPIVDAAMRELRETGWIHNGMRFLLACFLTKYLLLPWSRGLKAFYGLLLDGDHSSNPLGWQWTAGSNTDAFPFTCLVNPVKVAYRHDPSGNYVRKWIPELAKLPTEFIHQPWKAPQELLSKHGIEIGASYPKRVVMMSEARLRASKAMSVMKQIFAGSTVRRNVFTGKDGDEVREWPDSQPDVLRMESVQSSSGKIGLLPSLWALLQCDQPPLYLAGTSSGTDAVIAMDTVSLVEGALPVSLDEQHRSIGHALISAHEQGPTDPILAPGGVLSDPGREIDGPSFGSDPECETGSDQRANPGPGGMDMQQLDEPLKYATSFPDHEKQMLHSGNGLSAPSRLGDIGGSSLKANQDLRYQHSQSATGDFVSGSHSTAFNKVATQYQHGSQPHSQQQLQQFQQFQQLHALGMQHAQQQQQQQAIAHLRHPVGVVTSQGQLPKHQPVRQAPDAQQERTHQQNRLHPQLSHSPSQPLVVQPNQTLHQPVSSMQSVSQSQRQHQVHQSQTQSVMDGLYNPTALSNAMHGTALTGVPLTAAPVMMGPMSNGVDPSTSHAFGSADPSNALYSHHLGMNQFYGFPSVMSVMNNPHPTSNERFEMLGVSAATNSQKLTVPGMVPLGYGMYGGGVFEPSAVNNPFASNGNSYGAGPMNTQSHAHPSQQSPYGLPTQVMYCPHPPGSDVPRTSGTIGATVTRESHLSGTGHSRPGSVESGARRNKITSGTNIIENAAGERDMVVSASSEHHRERKQDINGGLAPENRPHKGRGFAPPSSPITRTQRSRGSVSAPVRASSRSGAKGGVKGKQYSRNRRSGKPSSSSNKLKSENRGQSGNRGKAGERNLHRNKPVAMDKGQATTLKSRQEMLTLVLESKEHEYHAFARYLSVTYELTGNTDRQTSRDYIRLRNLKEDYLRQFPAEKDKLKIYSMKRFFSQYLNLEVTGEWDRHSHGGVRGPYVYGIKARTQTEPSGHAAKS